jgi:hypothetical protein
MLNKKMKENKFKTEKIVFQNPPHCVESKEIWTYEQFKLYILDLTPSDFLEDYELTYIASYLIKFLEECVLFQGLKDSRSRHLVELVRIMEKDLKKYQPTFWKVVHSFSQELESNSSAKENLLQYARYKRNLVLSGTHVLIDKEKPKQIDGECDDLSAPKKEKIKITLAEALEHASPTREKDRVRCKECKKIFVKKFFFAHWKKHVNEQRQ